MDEWVVSQYVFGEDLESIDRMTIDLSNSPFFEGNRWAVRYRGRCLSIGGKWVSLAYDQGAHTVLRGPLTALQVAVTLGISR